MFLYWFPNVTTKPTVDQISDAGLSYALTHCTARGSENGPDKGRGVTVCEGGNDLGKLGYWPNKQTWRQIPKSTAWAGHYTDELPTPKTMERSEQISGKWIEADDGSKWLAPIARRWHEMNGDILWDYNLPRRMQLNDEGIWEPGDVTAKYRRLWEGAMAYQEAALQAATDSSSFTFDVDALAIAALQVNYRIGAVELDMLGIYDMGFRDRVVSVLLDMDTYLDWLKKKQTLAARDTGSS